MSTDLTHWGLNKMATRKQLEIHGYVVNIVANNVWVLKHQAISIHSADILDQFHTEILYLQRNEIIK